MHCKCVLNTGMCAIILHRGLDKTDAMDRNVRVYKADVWLCMPARSRECE